MDFPKKQQQCLIPRYLLQYLTSLEYHHLDPTAPWGGGGGGSYTAGDGIEISDEDVISIDNTVALKTDIPSLTGYATETWVSNQDYVTSTDLSAELLNYAELNDLATVATTGDYDDLSNTPDLSVYELAADAFSGDYNDLTNKPTIPVVPTNVSAFTNDAGYITSSALTGYVTTDTDQNITGVKTFVGRKKLAFKESIDGDFLGFTAYNINGYEFGNLQAGTRSVKLYTGSTSSTVSKKLVTLGNYSDNNLLQKDCYVGFRVKDLSNQQRNFVVPKSDFSTYYNIGNADTYYIPMGITDGTTTCLATSSGIIDISSLLSGGSSYTAGTGIDITNDVISIDNTVALKSEIPTVPTNVSSFTNDAGYITSSTLTGYATETWVTNQGYSTFSGSYNDLTDKPTIPVVPTNVSSFTNDAGYITSSALTGYATETWVTNQGYSTFSGSYNDLTDKPTIPDAVSGTNDGTNWTSLTIGNATYGLASGSTPSNMVTTNTTQTITGTKTFQGTYYTTKINDITGLTVTYSGDGTVVTLGDNININKGGRSMSFNPIGCYIGNFTNTYTLSLLSNGTTVGEYTFKNKTGDVAVTSEIPTSATSTSTSTVAPSTIQLTFTFDDDTTQTVTLMTGATVSTTTTTTLS